jgi:flagellar hook-length control protein FliK
MAGQGISSASLRLTPEQLGPVEVKISVHQNAASVWFSASQPETRAALEQALPRLKELFSAQGLNLAQAGVSDHSARGAQREPQAGVAPRTLAARELTVTSLTSAPRAHQGLIDTYA